MFFLAKDSKILTAAIPIAVITIANRSGTESCFELFLLSQTEQHTRIKTNVIIISIPRAWNDEQVFVSYKENIAGLETIHLNDGHLDVRHRAANPELPHRDVTHDGERFHHDVLTGHQDLHKSM